MPAPPSSALKDELLLEVGDDTSEVLALEGDELELVEKSDELELVDEGGLESPPPLLQAVKNAIVNAQSNLERNKKLATISIISL